MSKKHTGRVSQLINLEETKNGEQGSRFLLELMVELHNTSELINTSEYVFLPKGEDKLCHTSNFQWKKKVDVHLVVSGGCGLRVSPWPYYVACNLLLIDMHT